MDLEVRHGILAVHLFAGLGFFAFGALSIAAGQAAGGALRVMLGLLVAGGGFYIYRLRSQR